LYLISFYIHDSWVWSFSMSEISYMLHLYSIIFSLFLSKCPYSSILSSSPHILFFHLIQSISEVFKLFFFSFGSWIIFHFQQFTWYFSDFPYLYFFFISCIVFFVLISAYL
jgi:hypothetical protein